MNSAHDGHPRIRVPMYSATATIPNYETALSSGCDLRADIPHAIELQPLERTLIPTGIFVAIPVGYEGQIRPRSGQALKKGLSMPNSPGTIDADYRGELKVLTINLNPEPIAIEPGERIAQLIFAPVVQADFLQLHHASDLPQTVRGEGGFGSTGT